MNPSVSRCVCLRPIAPGDLPRLYEFNCDAEANRLAATIPRSVSAFDAHWRKVLADSNIVVKAIDVEGRLAGTISCFPRDGSHFVGYWLGREFWGQGIASRAWELLLSEVTHRPLYAHAATGNGASLRVLEKCGFVVRSVRAAPADDRYLACDEALLVLE